MNATQRQVIASLLLQAQGYSPEGAAAIVGNLSQESGRNLPSSFRTNHLDHGSNGLPQWRLERLNDYETYVHGLHPTSAASDLWQLYGRMAYQIAYIAIEMKRDYASLDAKLRVPGGNVAELTQDVCWDYERPNRAESGIMNRVMQAQATYATAPKAKNRGDAMLKLNEISSVHAGNAANTGVTALVGGAVTAGGAVHLASTGGSILMWSVITLAAVVVGIVLAAAVSASQANASTKAVVSDTKTAAATVAKS